MKNKELILKMIVMSILIALAIVLQALATFIPSISTYHLPLGLVPVIVASVLYGPFAGSLVGFIWGIYILIYDSSCVAFFEFSNRNKAINVSLTITTVAIRGALDGLISGYLYKLFLYIFGKTNIAYKTCRLFKKDYTPNRGLKIFNEYSSVLLGSLFTCLANNFIFYTCLTFLFDTSFWPTLKVFFSVNFGIMVIISIICAPIIARVCIASQDVLNLHSKKALATEESTINE